MAGWAGGVEDAGSGVGAATGCEGKWSDQSKAEGSRELAYEERFGTG